LILDLLYIVEMTFWMFRGWKWRGEVHGKEGQKNEKVSVYVIMIFILMISLSYGWNFQPTHVFLPWPCYVLERDTHPHRRDEAAATTIMSLTHPFFFHPGCWKRMFVLYIQPISLCCCFIIRALLSQYVSHSVWLLCATLSENIYSIWICRM
jgi:hypothetical protein